MFKKREKLYLGLFSLLAVLAFAAFAYSQGPGGGGSQFSTGVPVPNPGHPAQEILCDKCIVDTHVADQSNIFTQKF